MAFKQRHGLLSPLECSSEAAEVERTEHNLGVEVVDQLSYELAFYGYLVSQHAQVVTQLSMLGDDDTQARVLVLRPASPAKNLLHIQHACKKAPSPPKPIASSR